MTYEVTLIPGDGIGPEITAATVSALEATGIAFAWDTQLGGMAAVEKAGGSVELIERKVEYYANGVSSGVLVMANTEQGIPGPFVVSGYLQVVNDAATPDKRGVAVFDCRGRVSSIYLT